MSTGEVVRETPYTQTERFRSGTGPSYSWKTKRCVFCDMPRSDWRTHSFPTHLEECDEAPR